MVTLMSLSYLRVKIKSLAEEARIIRHEADRYKRRNDPTRLGLHDHRRGVVRPEARNALLAYGYLRGRLYAQIEASTHEAPNWPRVARLIEKYGPAGALVNFAAWRDHGGPGLPKPEKVLEAA